MYYNSSLFLFIHLIVWTYSWFLNNMSLNLEEVHLCVDLFNNKYYTVHSWLNPLMWNSRYGGIKPCIGRDEYKLYANFQLLRGISSLPQPLSCSVVSYNIIFLFQKKILLTCEWVKSLSRVRLFATLWTGAHQAPQSIGFSRQEYRSGLPFPPADLPSPRIKPMSPA